MPTDENVDTFIDMEVGDAVELEPVEEGIHTVLCNGVQPGVDKNGNRYFLLRLEVPDVMESKGFTHFLSHPADADDEKQRNLDMLSLKRVCEAFGLPTNNFDLQDLQNETAEAALTIEEDEQYGRSNNVQRWVTGEENGGDTNRAEELALE